jgi:formate hydrogenlyase subunit 4
MKTQSVLSWLVPLVGVLALVAAAIGLFWQVGGSPYTFTTLQVAHA